MIDNVSADIEAVQLGVVDARTPEAERPMLAVGLVWLWTAEEWTVMSGGRPTTRASSSAGRDPRG